MSTDANPEVAIRAACDAGDFDQAATVAIRNHGPEILGFLVGRLRNEGAASEVFSLFCEDLWKGLEGFGWRCTARAWAFTIARHAASRYMAKEGKHRNHKVTLSGRVSRIAEQVRMSTLPYLRTRIKSRMRELYDQLPEQDRTLLTLRLDKGFPFRDVAAVLLYDGGEPDEAELTREAARLRKRFQLAKERLRELAEAEGLIEP